MADLRGVLLEKRVLHAADLQKINKCVQLYHTYKLIAEQRSVSRYNR